MYFANPWGLLALLALPAIVTIHLFHQRFPPLLVAGAHLWGAETRVTTAGRRRERLPVTPSLLLELLAALLLTVALSEPHFAGTDEVVHIVAVLDDSASMLAHAPDEPSPRDLAVAELDRRADAGGRGSRLTLIRTGTHPTLLGSRGMRWDEATAALAEWRPRAPRHDFAPAWDEAAQVAGAGQPFLFLTDSVPQNGGDSLRESLVDGVEASHGDKDADTGGTRGSGSRSDPATLVLPREMEVLALGRRLENVAISAARWTFDSTSGQGEVFFRVSNYGAAAARVQAAGTSAGQSVFRQTIDVPAGGEVPLQIGVPGGLGSLTVTATAAGDGLETDNEATLIEPKVRTVTLAVTLPADSREFRLVQRVLTTLPDVQPGPVEQAHLLIGPADVAPPARRDLWWLGIGPLDPGEAAQQRAVTLRGPYILDKRHPLLEGIVLDGVIWAGAQEPPRDVTPLISCNRLPLLAQRTGVPSTAYWLNIDLESSNIDRSPDWPILLTNLVELRRDALPGLRRWNYRVNDVVQFRAPAETDGGDVERAELMLIAPAGRARPLIRDRQDVVEMAGLDTTGVHEIRQGGRLLDQFAVNCFDAEESSLLTVSPGRRTPPQEYEPTLLRIDNPYSWLIVLAVLLVLAAVLLDWQVVRRASTTIRAS